MKQRNSEAQFPKNKQQQAVMLTKKFYPNRF